jgi:hypothetical protein
MVATWRELTPPSCLWRRPLRVTKRTLTLSICFPLLPQERKPTELSDTSNVGQRRSFLNTPQTAAIEPIRPPPVHRQKCSLAILYRSVQAPLAGLNLDIRAAPMVRSGHIPGRYEAVLAALNWPALRSLSDLERHRPRP